MAHFKSQLVLEPVQLSEQEPVQVMWQVAPPVQDTLPLAPTVRLHVEPPPQLALQDCAQLPEQVLRSRQLNEQLLEPQLDCETLHEAPCGQLQLAPEHVILVSPPQPTTKESASGASRRIFMSADISAPCRSRSRQIAALVGRVGRAGTVKANGAGRNDFKAAFLRACRVSL